MAADRDRRQRLSVPGRRAKILPTGIDLDRAARLARPGDEQIAHLLVLLRQGQPAHTGLAETADFARPLDGRPQPLGIDLEPIGRAHGWLSAIAGGRGHRAALTELGPGSVDLTGGHAQAPRHVRAGEGKLRRHGAATPIVGEAAAWLEAASLGNARKSGGMPGIARAACQKAEPSTVEVSSAAV